MCLPYWDSELDVEVGPWGSFKMEHRPVSAPALYSPQMGRLANEAMALESEFLYMNGLGMGAAGSMIWENSLLLMDEVPVLPMFTLIFGYSRKIESFLSDFLLSRQGLKGGVTVCTFWQDEVPIVHYKVAAVLGTVPLVDEEQCISSLIDAMARRKDRDSSLSYFAEKLGFLRAPVPYETDRPGDLSVTEKLQSFQLAATREVLGPSPSVPMPAIFDMAQIMQVHPV